MADHEGHLDRNSPVFTGLLRTIFHKVTEQETLFEFSDLGKSLK